MNAVAKKLRMKSGQHWLLLNAPDNYLQLLDPLPDGLRLSYAVEGHIDGIQLFVRNSAELALYLKQVEPVMLTYTVLWIILSQEIIGYYYRPGDDEQLGRACSIRLAHSSRRGYRSNLDSLAFQARGAI